MFVLYRIAVRRQGFALLISAPRCFEWVEAIVPGSRFPQEVSTWKTRPASCFDERSAWRRHGKWQTSPSTPGAIAWIFSSVLSGELGLHAPKATATTVPCTT